MKGTMSCPDGVELSRALVTGIDAALQAHLDACPQCAAEAAAHRDVADDTRTLPVFDPSPEHARIVRNALLDAAALRSVSPITAARRPWHYAAGFAAAAMVAAAAIWFVILRPSPSSPDYRASIHAHDGAKYIRVGAAPDEIVRLVDGTITVEVAPLAANERFRVITNDAEVEVRGTAFDVTAKADQLAGVRVLHGRVEVRAAGAAPKLLNASERWEMTLAAAEVPATDTPNADGVANVATTPNPTASNPTASNPTASNPTGSNPTSSRTAPSRSTTAPAPSATSNPTSSTSASPTAASPRSRSRSSTPAATSNARITHATPTSPSTPTSPRGSKRPIEVLFEQGWAALAAGKARDAASTFEQAATSAPNDPLAEDAWFWRASALARANSGDAVGALDHFLARYPRSPRAGEASAMLGWLVIKRDPERARALFEAAAHDRVPAVRASGEKGLAAVAKPSR